MVGKSHLLIRADANARMGTGHLMRCLALTQAWQSRGGEAIFITACESTGLLQRLHDEGFQVIQLGEAHPDSDDWATTSQALAAHSDAWVVLDGYHFDPAYQRQIKESGHPVLVIDDMAHLDYYYADVVLNQNINAEQLRYSCEPTTRLLLGTRYALLRSEFLAWRGWQREIPKVACKVLVTLGGGDPDNQTSKVIRALQRMNMGELEAVVVVGASNPHFQELQSTVRQSQFAIQLIQNVSNMPELMAWADVAVSAGGTTCWEMAFMGLPSQILITADNQRAVAAGLHERGVAVSLGWWEQVREQEIAELLESLMEDVTKRAEMSHLGRQLVDGRGSKRTLEAMEESVYETSSNW
jgi:UDP-2,4-diacetamido-2,4,6-trideoxy-beta-L-altropyranose hydrolase